MRATKNPGIHSNYDFWPKKADLNFNIKNSKFTEFTLYLNIKRCIQFGAHIQFIKFISGNPFLRIHLIDFLASFPLNLNEWAFSVKMVMDTLLTSLDWKKGLSLNKSDQNLSYASEILQNPYIFNILYYRGLQNRLHRCWWRISKTDYVGDIGDHNVITNITVA